jgi:ABC-type polysaccharide/polyol phosphate export permease
MEESSGTMRHIQVQLRLTWLLTCYNLRTAMKNSVLGWVWYLALPLILLVIYTFAFRVLFGRQKIDGIHPAVFIFTGQILVSFISQAMQTGAGLFQSHSGFLLDHGFPRAMLPLAATLECLITGTARVLMLILGALVLGVPFSLTTPLALLAIVPLTIWMAAAVMVCAVFGGYFSTDFSQVLNFVAVMLIFGSPVFYSIERIPAGLRPWLELNPLTTIITHVRGALFKGAPSDAAALLWVTVAGLAVLAISYLFYVRHEPTIIEQL